MKTEDESETESDATYRHENVDFSPLYASLGMFVIEFEKVSTGLRFSYSCILQLDGLKTWALGANLLNIAQIGPTLLAIAFCAGVHQTSADAALRARATKLLKECKDLTEERNNVIHGEWYVGPEMVFISPSATPPESNGIKRKASKSGETGRELSTVAKLNQLITRSQVLRKEIQAISSAFAIAWHDANPSPET